ncbi:acyl-CoA thioesterase [Frigidibacter sp. MR17.14]|uniref:acyl-CoA thioesterase n=1 Tax=Frigidibacter sp. MR17.14 TaxID=3126509 RepID=UPI003012F14E
MPHTPPDSRRPALRTIAMPADMNLSGNVFGGWIMAQMDMAAGATAGAVARGSTSTVAVEAMSFIRPVKVGDEVTVYTEVLKIGTSSIRIAVEVWCRKRIETEAAKVTEGVFTFVAIDENGRPRPVPRD